MIDVETYGAAVGAAKRYTDEHSGSDDAVKYTEQSLTSEQQAQARENIGAAASTDIPTDAVKYTAQTLTDAQKTQARTNIGVVQPDWNAYNSGNPDFIKNKPLVKVGQGTGGNLISGTGLENNTNEAKKLNSIAHGRNVTANGNYSIAAGQYVQANNDYEIAYGRCNQSNADTVFSIGDGVDTQNRHNLMELKTDGTLLLNGNAVKTEGGDDNKLRLGKIWGMKFSSSSSTAHAPAYGFNQLFTSVSSVTFQSDTSNISSNANVYQFGDFVGFVSSNAVTVQPLRGELNYPTTGQWIKVENCYFMFAACVALASIDLSMFDTSNAKSMQSMFYECNALASIDLSMFDTSNVKSMRSMFFGCYVLTSLDVSNFDTSNITTMREMFYNCRALTSLNLSNFDTSEVEDMSSMFTGCTALTSLDLSSFDMSNVTNSSYMFGTGTNVAPPLTTLKTPKINPRSNISLNRTLYSQDGTAYTNLPVTTGTSIELRQSWT